MALTEPKPLHTHLHAKVVSYLLNFLRFQPDGLFFKVSYLGDICTHNQSNLWQFNLAFPKDAS